DTGQENKALNYAQIYTGVHLHEYFSLHGDWVRKRFINLGYQKDQVEDDAYPRSAFAQIGNVALNRFRLTAGKVSIPFGIDFRPLLEIYNEALKTRSYWATPHWGTFLTYDTLVSSQFQIGYATNRLK